MELMFKEIQQNSLTSRRIGGEVGGTFDRELNESADFYQDKFIEATR